MCHLCATSVVKKGTSITNKHTVAALLSEVFCNAMGPPYNTEQ
jgi:hypothetical protein